MTRAIPFRGYLLAWATAGHNVIVFEGHPTAFESGVRNADVLLMDSGMLPFVQFNWVEAAQRVMQPEGTGPCFIDASKVELQRARTAAYRLKANSLIDL